MKVKLAAGLLVLASTTAGVAQASAKRAWLRHVTGKEGQATAPTARSQRVEAVKPGNGAS